MCIISRLLVFGKFLNWISCRLINVRLLAIKSHLTINSFSVLYDWIELSVGSKQLNFVVSWTHRTSFIVCISSNKTMCECGCDSCVCTCDPLIVIIQFICGWLHSAHGHTHITHTLTDNIVFNWTLSPDPPLLCEFILAFMRTRNIIHYDDDWNNLWDNPASSE